MLLLPSPHVYILCLDHSLYSVLATGYLSPGAVSNFLDTHHPVQDTWYCSGWFFGFNKRSYFVTGKVATSVENYQLSTGLCFITPDYKAARKYNHVNDNVSFFLRDWFIFHLLVSMPATLRYLDKPTTNETVTCKRTPKKTSFTILK